MIVCITHNYSTLNQLILFQVSNQNFRHLKTHNFKFANKHFRVNHVESYVKHSTDKI